MIQEVIGLQVILPLALREANAAHSMQRLVKVIMFMRSLLHLEGDYGHQREDAGEQQKQDSKNCVLIIEFGLDRKEAMSHGRKDSYQRFKKELFV